MQSRYYDPVVKRFLNADKGIDYNAGFVGYNLFSYCASNPVAFVDQSGNSISVPVVSTIEIPIRLPSGFDIVVRVEVDGCIDILSEMDLNIDCDDKSFKLTFSLPSGQKTSFCCEYTLSADSTKASAMLSWGSEQIRGCVWEDYQGAAAGVTFNGKIQGLNARFIVGIRFSSLAAVKVAAQKALRSACSGGTASVNPYSTSLSVTGISPVSTITGSWFPWVDQPK